MMVMAFLPLASSTVIKDVTGFFSILAEWSRADLTAPANDNEATSDDEGAHYDR